MNAKGTRLEPARVAPRLHLAQVRVRHAGCVTETILGPTRGIQIGEEDESHLILVSSEEPWRLDAFVEEWTRRSGGAPEVLHRSEAEVLIRGRISERCVTRLLRADGGRIVWPASYYDGWEEFTVLGELETLRHNIASIPASNVVEVLRVEPVASGRFPVSVSAADLTANLTRRQMEVLQAAVEHGYYEAPRRIPTEDLARLLGITPSTLKEHLRKAEESLVMGFEALSARLGPLVSTAATRRPGRPRTRATGPSRAGPQT